MPVATLEIPIEESVDGALRVGGTRVTLETLIVAFNQGATAEEIALRYPALKLADVYSAISFILQNPAQIESYLEKRQSQSADIRAQNESRFKPEGVRSRLLARRGHA